MKKYKPLLITIYMIILITGSIFLIESISFVEVINTDLNTLLTTKNVNYEVYLVKNTAIEEEKLEMNKSYISKLVDYIKFDYDYTYTGDSNLEYSLIANLTVEYQNTNVVSNPVILKKEYPIIETTKIQKETNKTTKIERTANLDYKYYQEELNRIQNVINVPVKAYIDLTLKIIDIKNGTSYNSIMSIPIGQEVFSITNKTTMKNELTQKEQLKINEAQCIIGIIMDLLAIIGIIKTVTKSHEIENENYYTMKLNRILQSYGDIIVEMLEPIDTHGLQVKNVKNFEQLVDVEEQLRTPIIFYETKQNREGEFIIIHGNIAYRYILKNIKSNYKYRRKI